MKKKSCFTLAVSVACCSLLLVGGGCITAKSQGYEYFALESVADDSPAATDLLDGGSFYVKQTEIPAYLDDPRIVTRAAVNQLQFAEFSRWSETLDKAITRVVANDLAAAFGSLNYSYYPNRIRSNNAFDVSITVQRFERLPDSTVIFVGSWRLFHDGEKKLILPLKETATVNGVGYGSTVHAMSIVLGKVTARIAERLEEYLEDEAASETP